MPELVKNLIVTILIAAIMGYLFKRHKSDSEKEKKDKRGKRGVFEIKGGGAFNTVVLISTGVLASIFVVTLGNMLHWWGTDKNTAWWVVIEFGFFVFLCFILISILMIWKVSVNGEDIIYRDYIGIKHHYTWDDVDRIVMKKDEMVVYGKERRLFTVNMLIMLGQQKFFAIADKRGIPLINGMTNEPIPHAKAKPKKKLENTDCEKEDVE